MNNPSEKSKVKEILERIRREIGNREKLLENEELMGKLKDKGEKVRKFLEEWKAKEKMVLECIEKKQIDSNLIEKKLSIIDETSTTHSTNTKRIPYSELYRKQAEDIIKENDVLMKKNISKRSPEEEREYLIQRMQFINGDLENKRNPDQLKNKQSIKFI